MKLFLTVALSLTAIALIAHAQEATPSYPPPPGPPGAGYLAPPPPPDMPPANTEIIPPSPPSYAPPPAQQAVTPSTAMPQDQAPLAAGPQPQTQGSVSFVSGGAGDEDRAALKAMESQYNVRLLFAVRGSGDFLAGINVTLTDSKGNVALDTISDGPIFYARVPAGHYKLTVANQGQSQSANINVSASGAVGQSFYWSQAS